MAHQSPPCACGLLPVAGVVLVALALAVRGIVHRSAAHSSGVKSSVQAGTTPGSGLVTPFGVTADRSLKPKEPTSFTGVVASPDRGRLLLTGPRPGWFWAATGTFQPIAGLPRWQAGYWFTRVTGGWAVQRYNPPQASCLICDAPPAVYFVPYRQAHATAVGEAYDATAGVTRGTLWLTAYLPDANLGTASGTAQEVTVGGHALGPPLTLPAGYVIDRAVRGGFLLTPYSQRPGLVRDELWSPVKQRVVREFTSVVAASPDQIAWTQCVGRCSLRILRLSSGATVTIPLAMGASAESATFNSDGSLLAVQVTTAVQPDGFAAATRLEAINTGSGHVTALPGTTISSLIAVSFGWQPGSDRLLAAVARPFGVVQVASWQPGGAQLSVQAMRLPTGTSPVLG
jgi:hypothetical protein